MTGPEFVESLLAEVEAAMASNRDITPPGLDQAELPPYIVRHWLNFAVYYEKAATVFIGGWMKTTDAPDAVVHLAHQIEDEANHYSWLREHLLEFDDKAADFVPPKEWRRLMEEFYPGLDHLVERLAAHNIASEIGALGFMEFNMAKFPPHIRATVEKVCNDEKYHVAFGKQLLGKYCTTPALQAQARAATQEALSLMRAGREVFVQI
jgi:rubrerythrin